MPRKNYLTINAHETIQEMFEEFTTRRQLTKTVALNDMLEMYMLAKDEELYLELKKKYLHTEFVRQMLTDRDSSDAIDSEDESFIFMKLANALDNQGQELTAHEMMQLYITDQSERGYTWFSTQSLFYGMSPKRVKSYKDAIALGNKVTILFAIGRSAGGKNDIAYKANVMDIISHTEPKKLDIEEYPSEWRGEAARIWLKINGLNKESTLTANLFEITSSGIDLQHVINNSQYHFGYVNLKQR